MTLPSISKTLGKDGFVGTDSDITLFVELRTCGFWSNIFCALLLMQWKGTPLLLQNTRFADLKQASKDKVIGYSIQCFADICVLLIFITTGGIHFFFSMDPPLTFEELNLDEIERYQTAFASAYNIFFMVYFHELLMLDLRQYIWFHHAAFISCSVLGYILLVECLGDLRVFRMYAGCLFVNMFEFPLYLHIFLYRVFRESVPFYSYAMLTILYALGHLLAIVMWIAYMIDTIFNVTKPNVWTNLAVVHQFVAISIHFVTSYQGHLAQYALTKKIWEKRENIPKTEEKISGSKITTQVDIDKAHTPISVLELSVKL